MKKSTEYLAVFALFCLLEIIFWYHSLLPGMTLFMKDLSNEMPYRFFWAHSKGIPLWIPFGFFGIPFAANPQAQAFYPFNFFYLLFGVERGLVFYIIFHHFFFLITLYLAFRRLGFGIEASLIGSIGFSFGGFFSSLTILILLLSTITWFPLIIIVLSLAAEKNWMRWSLLLGPIIALQVLAGEIEIAAMSWLLAVIAVLLSPKNNQSLRLIPKTLGALLVGIFFGASFSSFQLALFRQMIPLSNRAQGLSLQDAQAWSLELSQLKAIIIPSYIIPADALSQSYGNDWGLGFLAKFPYFLSFYAGIIILLLASWGLIGQNKAKSFWWLLVAFFSLALAIGEQIPFYGWLFNYFPGFKFFRFPVKFYFLFSFAVVSLSALGFSELGTKSRPRLAWPLLAIGILVALAMLLFPIKLQELGGNYALIENKMILHVVFRTLSILLIGAGLMALLRSNNKLRVGLILAIVAYFDLFFAHHWLNPPGRKELFKPSETAQRLINIQKQINYPVRIMNFVRDEGQASTGKEFNPLSKFAELWNDLEGFSPIYSGLNTYRAYGTFHPHDILTFNNMIIAAPKEQRPMLFARAGIEYMFLPGQGFLPVSSAFPRASIFYQARFLEDRGQIFKIWSDPDFPAKEILLVEGISQEFNPAQESVMSEPAQIVKYENDQVEIEAFAQKDAWLLLLDSFYPGWKAELDSKPVEIFRADGFFRAVRIPAGKHQVIFSYQPEIYTLALRVAAISFILWSGLLVLVFRRK